MRYLAGSILIMVMVFFCCSFASAEDIVTPNKEYSGFFGSLERIIEKNDAKIKEKGMGSIIDKPKEGNFAFFKDAKFHLRGDFQINGVYYNERDLNGYNGNETKWDPVLAKYVRTQTNEKEAWMYHDLTLKPIISFNDDTVIFHSELYHGGYMWEMDVPDAFYAGDIAPSKYQGSVLDYQKVELNAAFLEMITPFGLIAAGVFPKELGNLRGVTWAVPAPKAPEFTLILTYGVKNEGRNLFASESAPGVDYLDTQNADSYVDDDDQTVYVVGGAYDSGEYLQAYGAFEWVKGGSEAPGFTNLDIKRLNSRFEYRKGDFHLFTSCMISYGMYSELETNYSGEVITILKDGINFISDQLGAYQRAHFKLENLEFDLGVSFFTLAEYKIGDFTPEIGLLYISGGDSWYHGSNWMPRHFEYEGNRTPRPNIKAYLLHEIETKYYSLTSSLATYQAVKQENLSYQNMLAIKLGTTYQISKHFKVYTQALAAWRADTKYFEKDYWTTFVMNYGYVNMEYFNDPETNRAMLAVPIIIQHDHINYEEPDIDPFLGLELNAKLTWLARQGLEISLIGAFFSAGGFYEDILTPKPYDIQWVDADRESGAFRLVRNPETFYGPYLAANTYKSKDAWTVQLKFDFKFQ